ncbi:hypothetical protein JGH11_11010 [Dysgonomonas sp. Marseille-P4677]|uniref:hypothetical protein n=1 Tax=Dysgonomonas sp. Marseille-P4677 TaxID=2364790 RepID=UPI001913717B|nr:hypothetical protein [Dysgonomonas sp. Marseille-P4677]MBK5721403.1 hypothetical protein [Dysgonomonas sp. Marseille-P4677]
MSDIKQQIEEEAENTSCFKDVNKLEEYNEKTLRLVDIKTFKRGANFILSKWQEATHWRKVSEELPEDSMELKNFTSNAKRTDIVLVKLKDGTYDTDFRFVFLAFGNNCWASNKDNIVEWQLINP